MTASDQPALGDRDPTVQVVGEATVRTQPDEAIVWITLSRLDESPGAALSDVARRSEALVEMLDQLEIAHADRWTAGVTVREELDYTARGQRSRGHLATASVSVRLIDADLIGRLIIRASDQLAAQIAGPHWRISDANPARLEAATRAAANAREKAAAYAAGVGAQLGPVLSLSEPEHRHGPVRAMGVALAAAGSDSMPVEEGEQEVLAAIRATFALVST